MHTTVEAYKQAVIEALQDSALPYTGLVVVIPQSASHAPLTYYVARFRVHGMSESAWVQTGATEVEALANLYQSYRAMAIQSWGKVLPDLPSPVREIRARALYEFMSKTVRDEWNRAHPGQQRIQVDTWEQIPEQMREIHRRAVDVIHSPPA